MSADDTLSAEIRIKAHAHRKALELSELSLPELVDELQSLIPNDLLATSPTMLDFFNKTKRNLARQEAWEALIVAYSSYARKPDNGNSRNALRGLMRVCRLYGVSPAHGKLLAELARIFDEGMDAPPIQLVLKRRRVNRKDAKRGKEIRDMKTKGRQQKLFYQVALNMHETGGTLEMAIAAVARSLDGANPEKKEETVRKAWQENAKPYRRSGKDTITLWPDDIPISIALPKKGRPPKNR